MSLDIYNTLTRKKEFFEPISSDSPRTVKMYTCGQTVYNDIHMGNARFYVVFDTVRRYLTHLGYDVQFVQNFTDIDDKMITRAAEEGTTVEALAEKYIARTLEDLANLNVQPATANPRATHEIPAIIEMISTLINREAAYIVANDDAEPSPPTTDGCAPQRSKSVFFDVTRTTNYGKLSRKKIEDLQAGARIEVDGDKKSPADFILWKPAKPGEPAWDSPWGPGRPGWHIECSAMIKKYLGNAIDIHGGSADLIFPHHENEIAQSEAACDCDALSKYWMHCGLLTVNHKKMSKSQGNFQTLRQVAKRFDYDVIRFYLLSAHYRMPMEFGDTMLTAAARGLKRIRNCYARLASKFMDHKILEKHHISIVNEGEKYLHKYINAMNDDVNTADAISCIFEWVKFANKIIIPNDEIDILALHKLREQLSQMCSLIGIDLIASFTQTIATSNPSDYIQNDHSAIKSTQFLYSQIPTMKIFPDEQEISIQIAERQKARKNKNFALADKIRDELANQGILLEDTPDGVRWKRA
ncbi:MAG: cysteine--tRNA ligase [Defluviitaleaceae bacterium]|nr:cysteine--tRNA ligase [Defluviitaleaceae bacterium]